MIKLLMFSCLGLAFINGISSVFWSRKNSGETTCQGRNCAESITLNVYRNGHWKDGVAVVITREECAKKDELGELICPKLGYSVFCTLFSSWGTTVSSCIDVKTNDNVFVVPVGKQFIVPTRGVGHTSSIQHIHNPTGNSIILDTVSDYPRIFKLFNFFSKEEANSLILSALTDMNNSTKLKNSNDYNNDSEIERVSETALVYKTETAITIKKRAFDMLGLYPYNETLAEGLQVTRYEEAGAFNIHSAYKNPKSSKKNHNYDSSKGGSNRYVGLFLYLNTPIEGGHTVFPELETFQPKVCDENDTEEISEKEKSIGSPLCNAAKIPTATEAFAETKHLIESRNLSNKMPIDGWQHTLLAKCRTSLSIPVYSLEALLVYTQHPDGSPDYLTKHGSCPVIQGHKWVATLWVWNGQKDDIAISEDNKNKKELFGVSASFENIDLIGVQLYWEDQLWQELNMGVPAKVNTFAGHRWNVMRDQEILASWVISHGKPVQRFVLSSDDLPVYTWETGVPGVA